MGSLTWSTSDIPDLAGKTFIVTGGNSGVGYECSKELALHGGHVIIATHGQDPEGPTPADQVDGPGAVSKIKEVHPGAKVEYMELDLASFRSIHSFVEQYKARQMALHGLINNAGLQTPPDAKTEDGFEITIGINFFGPFYLTQLLLPVLKASTPARVVWVTSPEETLAETDYEDLRGDNVSADVQAYANSKLWDLMAGLELNDRLRGTGVESFACHPGMCRTDIFRKGDHEKMTTVITDWAQWIAGQSAASGALPLLYCAAAPELQGKGGTYYGAYYKGPWTPNVFNTQQRTPGNVEANTPRLRAKLFDEAMKIVNETAAKAKIEEVGGEPVTKDRAGTTPAMKVQDGAGMADASAPTAKGGEFGLEGITSIEGMTPLEGATDVEQPEGAALPGHQTGTSTHAPITGQHGSMAGGGAGAGLEGDSQTATPAAVATGEQPGPEEQVVEGVSALGLSEPVAKRGVTYVKGTAEAPAGTAVE